MKKLILMISLLMFISPILACGKKGPPVLRNDNQEKNEKNGQMQQGLLERDRGNRI